jgi:HIRAN domain
MRGQPSATATAQTLAELQIDAAQKTHQMLLDTKADFFRRFKESPNLSNELVGLRESILSNFDFLVMGFLCSVASADGPINAKEADVLNLLLRFPGSETSDSLRSARIYNEFLESLNKKDTNIPKLFGSIIGVAIQLGAVEQDTNYDPQNDSVMKCFEALGQAVSSADGDTNQSELASLSNFIAIAQSKAVEIAQKIQSQTDAGSNSEAVAAMPPMKQSVTNQKSTPQSQSGAFVSGDGSYRFEVVGESYYQVELERVVGGRTEDSARYKCVAILTPEPDNPYDPHAVCVTVDGFKVAHLSRDWAAKFNAVLASSRYAQAACNALIVGGWDRGGDDRGHFGIKLDIILPLDLKPTAPRPD